MTKVRSKFKCVEKTEHENGVNVRFNPVVHGSQENENFYKFTPSGEIGLYSLKKAISDNFQVGKEYYVDFVEA